MDTDNDFAAFEASANSDTPRTTPVAPADEPIAADETLELTEEDEAVEVPEDEERPEGKKRHKPAHERIAELTKARREAERERDELRQRVAEQPKPEQAQATDIGPAPDPADDKYEFGEADPRYIADLARFEVRKEIAEERAKELQEAQTRQFTEAVTQLDAKWQEHATKGAEKYEDFNEVVLESAAAQEWPCPPLVALAISQSEVGADVAYHLASNIKEAKELAALSVSDPLQAARIFGRLEARFETGNATKPEPRRVTNAPEPPKHQVRGAGGKFAPSADTTNFADFERMANAKK